MKRKIKEKLMQWKNKTARYATDFEWSTAGWENQYFEEFCRCTFQPICLHQFRGIVELSIPNIVGTYFFKN